MSQERSGFGFIAGLALGGLAGAAIGMLWSPRSGQENRDLLVEKFPEIKERAPEIVNRAPEILNRAKDEAMARIESGKDAFVEAAEETRSKLSNELDEKTEGRPSVA